MRFPRKNVDTWSPIPPKKNKVNEAYFFQARTFLLFSSIQVLFQISADIENSIVLEFMQMQIFKIHRPQKSGISKIYLHCRPNFWTPRFLRFVNFENLHLHKFEYNRIFDIRRNFEQSLNWRKKQKCASLKKVRSIHFFWGGVGGQVSTFFRGNRIF